MANQQPERAYKPLVRKPPDPLLSYYCFRETIETSPCCTSEPSSEEGGVRQRKRSREDPEEGPSPSKRLRTSYGQDPPHLEAVGKAEDSSEAREDSEVPGSSSGSLDTDRSGSGPSSSAGVERSDHSSTHITSSSRIRLTTYSTADFEALYEELEWLGQEGFGSVFAGYRREDRLPVAIKHIPMDVVEMTRVTLNGQLTDCPLEVSLMLRAAEDQLDPEGPCAVVLLLDWFQLDQELILVQERPPETIETSPWWTSEPPSEEGGVRQRKRSREDPEEGPSPSQRLRTSYGKQPPHVEAVGKAEAREDSEVPGSSSGSLDTDRSGSGPSSSAGVERSDHSSTHITSSSRIRLTTYSTADFEALYEELEWLGQEGFRSVFAGYRREDRLPVAIKHIPMDVVEMTRVTLNGQLTDCPLEVSLMLRAAEDQLDPEGPCAVVLLLDWFQLDQELILVQERPPETIETSPWWTSEPPSEEGGVRQRKRSREDPEEGPSPSQRLRTSYGKQPPHVEAVGKAEDSSQACEEPGVPGSLPRYRDTDRSGSGPSSSAGVERSDQSSAHISSSFRTCLTTYSTADFEALYEELEQLGQGGFGSVFAGYRRQDRLPVAIKHIPMDMVVMTRVILKGQLTDCPLEVSLMLRAADDQPDPEGPGAVVLLLDWFQLDQELILVQERPPETIETSPWWTGEPPSAEGGVRQRKRSREDPEEGPSPSQRLRTSYGKQPPHVEAVGKAEDSSEAREDSEVPGSSSGSRDTDRSGSGPSSSAGVERSDHSSTRISSSSRTCLMTYSTADFEALYEELEQLGQGGFGSVFAGYRRQDRLPVAIKHIPMDMVEMTRVTLNGQLTDCPLEVSLMLKAAEDQPDPEGPGAVVLLLDWFQLDQELILVQERPNASVDLRAYMRSKGSKLQEQEAKMILHQVVEGIQGLHSRGVLHRDIKPENLLVETGSDTPRVRIIDLGCGCPHNNELYLEFNGTDLYIPPEVYSQGAYRADPMTVWQLGVLLYEMLTGHVPFRTSAEVIFKRLPRIKGDISPNCKDFLKRCLTRRALGRPPLQSLLLHPWLQGAD